MADLDDNARGLSLMVGRLRAPTLNPRGTSLGAGSGGPKLTLPVIGSQYNARGTADPLSGAAQTTRSAEDWHVQLVEPQRFRDLPGPPRTKPIELLKPEALKDKAETQIMLANKETIRQVFDERRGPTQVSEARKRPPSDQAITALAIGMQENNKLSSDYPFGDVYPAPLPDRPLRLTSSLDARGMPIPSGPHLPKYQLTLPTGWGDPNLAVQSLTAYGDLAKRGNAANYGIYKMNWNMIKQTKTGKNLIEESKGLGYPRRKDPSADPVIQEAVGRKINQNTDKATAILKDAMGVFSMEPPNPYTNPPQKNNFWAGHRMGESGLDGSPGINWQDIRNYYDAIQAIAAEVKPNSDIWDNNIRIGASVPNI